MKRRSLPVTAYLVFALLACAGALGVITVRTSSTAFDRAREHAFAQLRSMTQETRSTEEVSAPQYVDLASTYAADPAVAQMDPVLCEQTLGGLSAAIDGGYFQVVNADGQVVCSVYAVGFAAPSTWSPGDWFAEALGAGEPTMLDPAIDSTLDAPAVTAIAPVMVDGTPVGAVIIVASTSYPLIVPDGAPDGLVLMILDGERDLVLATSDGAPVKAGDRVGATPLGRPIPTDHAITDVDGERRMYVDVPVQGIAERVLAGVSESTVLAPARDEMRHDLALGALSICIVLATGLLLYGRLARPLREVAAAIEANLDGDDTARAPIEGPAEVVKVGTVFNELIDERQAREADLSYRARHDMLTGLPNRAAVIEYLIDSLETDPHGVAVGFLDLDRFKHLNDAHGHALGDQLLAALGTRLSQSLDDVFVSRFGGDEYVFVWRDLAEADASTAADRIAAILRAPFHFGAQTHHVDGSFGIAFASAGDSPEDLVRNADTAMYRAKDAGRGGHAVFDQSMREWAVLRASTESDLHDALANNEFELHYQPKVRLSDGEIIGAEALVRWRHPTRGMVAPGEFIPVAEECGLIVPMGAWVLEEACRTAVSWRQLRGGVPLPIAVNLSASQLALVDFPHFVARTMELTGATVDDLVLELTESAILTNVESTTMRLRAMREKGLRVSIDDFGTGYSSLSYLQRLPIDELKIDRGFIAELPFDETSTEIVGLVVKLAHAIGLTVVAEGVENAAQLVALDAMECDVAQGFYLGRPAPGATLQATLVGAAAE